MTGRQSRNEEDHSSSSLNVIWPGGDIQNMGDQHGEHNKLQSTKSEESGAGNTTEKLCFIIRKKNEKIQKINLQLADKDDVIGEPELICIVLYCM